MQAAHVPEWFMERLAQGFGQSGAELDATVADLLLITGGEWVPMVTVSANFCFEGRARSTVAEAFREKLAASVRATW